MSITTPVRPTFPRKTRIDELTNLAYDERDRTIGKIGALHKMIHAGRTIDYQQYMTDVDTSKGCRIVFTITGTANPAHLHPHGGWSAAARLEIWEDVTLSTTGTEPTLYNSKRDSTFAESGVIISGASFYDPTASGTLIRTFYYGGAGGPFGAPGTMNEEHEIIAKGNSNYLFWLKTDADNNKASIGLSWYEVF